METLVEFINAPIWYASRTMLGAHPELLTAEVYTLLEELAQAQNHEEAVGAVEDRVLRNHFANIDEAIASYEPAPGAPRLPRASRIRRLPSYEDFLAEPIFDELTATVHAGRSLVFLMTTSAGSLAFVLHHSTSSLPPQMSVQPVWAEELSDQNLDELLVKRNGGKQRFSVPGTSLIGQGYA